MMTSIPPPQRAIIPAKSSRMSWNNHTLSTALQRSNLVILILLADILMLGAHELEAILTCLRVWAVSVMFQPWHRRLAMDCNQQGQANPIPLILKHPLSMVPLMSLSPTFHYGFGMFREDVEYKGKDSLNTKIHGFSPTLKKWMVPTCISSSKA